MYCEDVLFAKTKLNYESVKSTAVKQPISPNKSPSTNEVVDYGGLPPRPVKITPVISKKVDAAVSKKGRDDELQASVELIDTGEAKTVTETASKKSPSADSGRHSPEKKTILDATTTPKRDESSKDSRLINSIHSDTSVKEMPKNPFDFIWDSDNLMPKKQSTDLLSSNGDDDKTKSLLCLSLTKSEHSTTTMNAAQTASGVEFITQNTTSTTTLETSANEDFSAHNKSIDKKLPSPSSSSSSSSNRAALVDKSASSASSSACSTSSLLKKKSPPPPPPPSSSKTITRAKQTSPNNTLATDELLNKHITSSSSILNESMPKLADLTQVENLSHSNVN